MVKIYATGEAFLKENKEVLEQNILDTSFFIWNSKQMKCCDKENYIIKIEKKEQYLFLLKYSRHNLLLYGDRTLCEEAVDVLCEKEYTFTGVLASYELGVEFLNYYEKRMGGSHKINVSMDIMYAKDCQDLDTTDVEKCRTDDLEELVQLYINFEKEALHRDINEVEIKEKIRKDISNYFCIRGDNHIVAIAKKTKQQDKIGAISFVYTLPAYRGRGMARKIVTQLTKEILKEGKIPYLYVDKNNPISNHLYSSIGYVYGNAKYEFEYKR